MKSFHYLSFLIIFGTLFQNFKSSTCNKDILKYYGFEGINSPINYNAQIKDISKNFCPNLIKSCCSKDDWNKSQKYWFQASIKITSYLNNYYSTIQQIFEIQNSILPFLPNLQQSNYPACKNIDKGLFTNKYDKTKLHEILRNAFETFARIQRGFHCMVCDAQNQEFFSVGKDYSRVMIGVNDAFCPTLINYFEDFLQYKFFYIDPIVINMNTVVDCASGEENTYFDNSYRVEYKNFLECFSNNQNCQKICNEFRFGATNTLFLGKIEEYQKSLLNYQDLIQRLDSQTKSSYPKNNQNAIFFTEFFNQQDFQPQLGPSNGNLSRFDIQIQKDGIDLFKSSKDCFYEYAQSSNKITKSVTKETQTSSIDVSIHVNQEKEVKERSYKIEQLQAGKAIPSPTEISSLSNDLKSEEIEYEKELIQDSLINPDDRSYAGIKPPEPNVFEKAVSSVGTWFKSFKTN